METLPLSRSPLVARYLAGDAALQALYAYAPVDTPWAQVLQDRAAFPVDRARLVRVLRRQLTPLGLTPEVEANLAALREPTTFTITTGQQAGLAGGPLYTWYKARTAIGLCETLQAQFPQHRFVPVFWIASEDHDADEVRTVWQDWETPLTYTAPMAGAVGRHRTVLAHLPPLPQAFASHYSEQPTWGRAFQALLHSVLAAQGVLVLDADDAELKAAFVQHMVAEVQQQVVAKAMPVANAILAAQDLPLQLAHREVNLFFLAEGMRDRIRLQGDTYVAEAAGKRWTARLLASDIAAQPESFSPNATLRPVYQEAVLPNIAYVGGQAELAYWLQLRPVFRAMAVFFPVVLPRVQALAVPATLPRQLAELGCTLADVLRNPNQMLAEEAARWRDGDAFAALMAQQTQLMAALEALSASTDETLRKHVRAQQARQARFWQRLDHKLNRAAVQRHPARYEAQLRLQRQLQPHGLVQERVWGLFALGPDPVAAWQRLMAAVPPQSEAIVVWGC